MLHACCAALHHTKSITQCKQKSQHHLFHQRAMAIAAGADEQSQDPQLPTPTPGPSDPVGLQYAPLNAGDVLDQESSELGDADVASIATSDESFTTDDGEDSTTVGGKQTWTMSFEWQDGSADNAPDPSATFEESTDFDQPSSHCTHQTTMGTSGSSCEASDPSPVNSDHDWLQPWSGSSVGIPRTYGQDHSKTHQHRKESQPKPKAEPMSDEHKTAILGAMKNVKMDYIPRWAMQLEERRWLNAIKQKAAAQVAFS